MASTTLEKVCAYCATEFSVDTARRAWWSKKFCKDSCREKYHNKIRCYRAKTGTKSDRVVKPKLTEEQKQKNEMVRIQRSAESRRGMKRTDEQKARISEATKKAWAEGRLKGHPKSEETKAKLSASGLLAYKEGRAKPLVHTSYRMTYYEGKHGRILMRSKSETLFAKQLDDNNIDWQFEPRMFDMGWTTYTPDFYLPAFNRWVEIKGYWNDKAQKKFLEFCETHSASAVLARDILELDRLQEREKGF